MFDKIRLWWKFEGRYYHKDIINGVKNLYKWFPIVWKDRDHDHYFIYETLRFKLEQHAYGMSFRDRHTTAQHDAERMLLCARLCQLQQENLYETEYLDYVERAHKFTPTEDRKFYTVESKTMVDNLDEYFKRYPRQYNKVINGEITWNGKPADVSDRTEIAMYIANENQSRSRKLLFKILEENIEGFWD